MGYSIVIHKSYYPFAFNKRSLLDKSNGKFDKNGLGVLPSTKGSGTIMVTLTDFQLENLTLNANPNYNPTLTLALTLLS